MARSSSRTPAALVVVAALAALYVLGSSDSGSSGSSGSLPSTLATLSSEAPGDLTGASAPPGVPTATTATAAPSGTRARATTKPQAAAACKPTDQDRYVYHPWRLQVVRACIRVSGTVDAIRREADGDLHILLRLDAPYRSLLRPANQGEELGDLVIEPVCVGKVSQSDAIPICRSDPDPLPNRFPAVGEHVWMEGRYVLDTDHGDWAELHPLYRWGS